MPKTSEHLPNASIASNFQPHRVVALVYDQLCTFEFGIVAEIFGLSRPEIAGPWYDFKSVALDKGPLSAQGGLEFIASGTLKHLRKAQTIIVPGWRGKDEHVPAEMQRELAAAHKRGVRIISICSGIFVLAAAGLLNGRGATTHWRYIDDFSQKYPDVKIQRNSLYVTDGNIITSAGSSAGIDLCLHVVRADFGSKIANSVARRLVMHAHRLGGQSQFIEQPVPQENEANRLSHVLEHIRADLNRPHTIAELAKICAMSERTFQRKFTALTGMPVGRWVKQQRLARARELLETTSASIEQVSDLVGAPNVEALRYHFRRSFGVSPGQYRKRFAS